jgi:hypothetical protein
MDKDNELDPSSGTGHYIGNLLIASKEAKNGSD